MEQHQNPSLGFLLVDAARLLRRRFEQEYRDYGMTSAQLQIIGRLSKNEGINQAGLAGLLDLEPMTLCRHVDRMEAADLVERRPDPNDRRARCLFTTEKSRALFPGMRQRAEKLLEQAQAGMPPEEREALYNALAHLVRNLSDTAPEQATQRQDPQMAGEAA